METRYVVTILMKTLNGYMETGRFFIAYNLKDATALFEQFESMPQDSASPVLTMELCVVKGGAEHTLGKLTCSLRQVTDNTALILKETFKSLNLI